MGVSFSCPFAVFSDPENGVEYEIRNSFKFLDKDMGACEAKTPPTKGDDVFTRSTSIEFTEISGPDKSITNNFDLELMSPKHEADTKLQISGPDKTITSDSDLELMSPKHEAATKLQKVYKSFRTRRKLADCAVVIEQSWWKLLDFAELKRSSISFFDVEKHETAISRWSRARTRAAKVGKGLLKNSKAQKLALQHWLEAIDPRHRYGHNLHPYFNKWLQSQSLEPFFYWLDIGEGKQVNLIEEIPRSKLQYQCIKYLGPLERLNYEVVVNNGKFIYKKSGILVDTFGVTDSVKWIFVLSTSMSLYIGRKTKGVFQHSSFLAGGATSSAGRIVVQQGSLKAIWPHSGHYRPTAENFQDFVSFLRRNNVDLTNVKMDPEDDENSVSKRDNLHPRSNSSQDFQLDTQTVELDQLSLDSNILSTSNSTPEPSRPMPILRKLSKFSIRNGNVFLETSSFENQSSDSCTDNLTTRSPSYDIVEALFDGDENNEEIISKECIMKRINSHKDMESFQLGKQLSCKWSTGAGPRIGCMRDYPSKLQSHALEQLDLSPRKNVSSPRKNVSSPRSGFHSSPNSSPRSMPNSFDEEFLPKRRFTTDPSPLCK